LVANAAKAVRHPDKAYRFALRKTKETLLWDYYYSLLREPKCKAGVPQDPTIQDQIAQELIDSGLDVTDWRVNREGYLRYVRDAEYDRYRHYWHYRNVHHFTEKSLEHYVAAELLQLSAEDVYVDIASAESPAPDIYHRLYGCKVYRQDLSYPEGLRGDRIGGDAAKLPVPDGFATKLALHCSFEHFEQDSDIRFIREAARVLRKGGKLCILPLYLYTTYAIMTDPAALPRKGVRFDEDAVLYCARGWANRHGRWYTVPKFMERIQQHLDGLKLGLHVVQNAREIDPSCYLKFACLFEKE
jgi:hypothetical protein